MLKEKRKEKAFLAGRMGMAFSVEVKSPILFRSKEKWLPKRQTRQVM